MNEISSKEEGFTKLKKEFDEYEKNKLIKEKYELSLESTTLKISNLEDKLNTTIGRQWWKKYISAAFWSNIATPINLAITLFTTLTTGQAATDSLLSQDNFFKLSVATLIISTINTFFIFVTHNI